MGGNVDYAGVYKTVNFACKLFCAK